MCGISGAFSYGPTAPPVCPEELIRVRDAMATRGPDGAGLWTSLDGRIGLAHRRLAIIDLSEAGAQPMATSDGRLHVTFNGEIYNYRELRKELEGRGYCFWSNSDTEVLLHLYADRGEDMVHALRGMFAFAIWDDHSKILFLARDPFGIKPLYFADDGNVLRFASQVKALVHGGSIDTTPEPAGSVGFLVWGYVPEPFTLYKGIHALPAGTYMRLPMGGSAQARQYFSVADEFRQAEESSREELKRANEIIRDAVLDSVRCHLLADVPVGLFLSAGIDSSTIAADSAQLHRNMMAVTLGFREFENTVDNEVALATTVARAFGIAQIIDWVSKSDFESERDTILRVMDQPTTDGVNCYFVARAMARSSTKVALSGLGGDELFGGYPSFRQVPRMVRLLSLTRSLPFVGRLIRRALAGVMPSGMSPKYAGLCEYGGTFSGAYLLRRALFMPWEISSVLDSTTVEVGLEKLQLRDSLESVIRGLSSPRSRVAALELTHYMRNQLLRDADWAGMAHSIEIRVPFVDVNVFRAMAPLIASRHYPSKLDLASAAAMPLPVDVTRRVKTGFSTPVSNWLNCGTDRRMERGLRGWARKVLPVQPKTFRVLALVTEAFGGRGGIAKFNRDLLEAIAVLPECVGVVAVPRLLPDSVEETPSNVQFRTEGAGHKLQFVRTTVKAIFKGRIDLLVVGHINLALLGAVTSWLTRTPSILILHGIDAWAPHKNPLVRWAIHRFTYIVAVSRLTLTRFASWASVDPSRHRVLPNCVDLGAFGPGSKSEDLTEQLGLKDRVVLMTLGRLASRERCKGYDEVLEVLPTVARYVPNVSYLICGDGDDRIRLEAKVDALRLRDRVVFAGFVPEAQKADYYRLADAYVMPSRGEGFGIVLLEALASGLPVMGSLVDGSREALLNGKLGSLVDPSNPSDVIRGILEVLHRCRGSVPESLREYSEEAFQRRAARLIRETLAVSAFQNRLRAVM